MTDVTAEQHLPHYDMASTNKLADAFYDLHKFVRRSELLPEQSMAITAQVRRPERAGSLQLATKLTDELTTDWSATETPEELVATAIKDVALASGAVDKVKISALGPGGSIVGSNTLMGHMRARYAFRAAAELHRFGDPDNVRDVLDRWNKKTDDVTHLDKPGSSWLAFKCQIFVSATRAMYETQNELLGRSEDLPAAEAARQAENLARQNDSLWNALQATRTYGVKPAIAPALPDAGVHEWLFSDTGWISDMGGARHERLTYGKSVADVTGASVPFVTSENILQHEDLEHAKMTLRDAGVLFSEDNQSDAHPFTLVIDSTGNLQTIEGFQLGALAGEYGLGLEYQKLRSELLSILFDLVVPVYVQEVADQEEQRAERAQPGQSSGSERIGKLRRLVLARTRTLEVLGEDIETAIREEREAEKKETQTRGTAKHKVIGFVRPLPKGYRASEKARQNAWEYDEIILAEQGETYVKPHERGSVAEEHPKGHKASYRAGQVATRQTVRPADPNGPIRPRPRKPSGKGKKR